MKFKCAHYFNPRRTMEIIQNIPLAWPLNSSSFVHPQKCISPLTLLLHNAHFMLQFLLHPLLCHETERWDFKMEGRFFCYFFVLLPRFFLLCQGISIFHHHDVCMFSIPFFHLMLCSFIHSRLYLIPILHHHLLQHIMLFTIRCLYVYNCRSALQ